MLSKLRKADFLLLSLDFAFTGSESTSSTTMQTQKHHYGGSTVMLNQRESKWQFLHTDPPSSRSGFLNYISLTFLDMANAVLLPLITPLHSTGIRRSGVDTLLHRHCPRLLWDHKCDIPGQVPRRWNPLISRVIFDVPDNEVFCTEGWRGWHVSLDLHCGPPGF